MNSELKIAAIFATMNRAQTAVACVRALAAQTRPPDLVVVADNLSSDDTVAALEGLTDLPFELIVLRMPQNRGNAGGVEDAMEYAFANSADAVWILDDDSWPREGALAALLDKPWEPGVVRHSLQIDPRSGRFSWPLQVADGRGGWRLVSSLEEMPGGSSIKSRITWTGAMVTRKIWDAVGPVNGALFIRGEDEEYPWRIEQAGFPQLAVRESLLDHSGPDNIVHIGLFGKNFFFERGLADWKLYYKVRNMTWLKRRQFGGFRALLVAVSYGIAASYVDGVRRIPLVCRAACDGWRGRLGKWEGH